MANISVNDIVNVIVVGRFLGQTTMNSYPFIVSAVTGTVSISTASAALNTALNAAGALYKRQQGCCPSNWTHTESWVQVIRPTRYRKFVYTIDQAGVYVDTDALTPNLQASIERYAEPSGRHDQGGVRIPIGTDPTSIDGGFITPALKAALELLATQMNTNIIAGGVTFLPITGVTAPAWAPLRVYGTNVKDTVRVIRRRTVGLGI